MARAYVTARAHSLTSCSPVSGVAPGDPAVSGVPEAVDRRLVARTLLRVGDAQAPMRRQGEYADLALVQVLVDVVGRLPHVLHRVRLGQGGVDKPTVDEVVRLPGLAVVREVRADDALEVHPQVPVVVLVQVPGRRGAGDDGAALAGDVGAGAEGLASRVLEHDVDVLAPRELADAAPETLPLPLVLGGLVLPEPVALSGALGAVDDQLGAHR